jgi:HEPN domain-containing protein
MTDLDGARRLLGMARKDLQALRGMTDSATFADEIFGFHAQQSVEKGLKAWLAVRGVEYPKTHDLRALLALLSEDGVDVEDLWDLVEYNLFAVQFRYEAFELFEEALDREAVIQRVAALTQRVEAVLAEAAGGLN